MSVAVFQFNSHLQKQAAGCIWPMGRKTAVDIPRPQLESQRTQQFHRNEDLVRVSHRHGYTHLEK